MIKILELKGKIIIYGLKNKIFDVRRRKRIAFKTNVFVFYSTIVEVVGNLFWELSVGSAI